MHPLLGLLVLLTHTPLRYRIGRHESLAPIAARNVFMARERIVQVEKDGASNDKGKARRPFSYSVSPSTVRSRVDANVVYY